MWKGINGDIAGTLDASYYKGAGGRLNKEREVVYWSNWDGKDVTMSLTAHNAGGGQRMPDKDHFNCVIGSDEMGIKRVRRLTPKECERLQSFPDDWTKIDFWTDENGKKHRLTDTPRYKAIGNSIACCAWVDILQGIAERCPEGEKTMGSLFDGIGGFPLIWRDLCGGKAVWASEVDQFCISVTKARFPEEEEKCE